MFKCLIIRRNDNWCPIIITISISIPNTRNIANRFSLSIDNITELKDRLRFFYISAVNFILFSINLIIVNGNNRLIVYFNIFSFRFRLFFRFLYLNFIIFMIFSPPISKVTKCFLREIRSSINTIVKSVHHSRTNFIQFLIREVRDFLNGFFTGIFSRICMGFKEVTNFSDSFIEFFLRIKCGF